MESRANYLVIGSVAVGFAVALFGFVLWLEHWGLGQPQQRYVVVFGGAATPGGLEQGDQVRFHGIGVGSISSIRLDPSDRRRALAEIAIDASTPVRADSVATEASQGFTGQSYLAISDGSAGAPLLEPAGGKLPTIEAKPGGIAALLATAPEIVDKVQKLADRASALVGGGQSDDLGATLKNLRTLTAALAGRDQELGRMVDDLAAASASIRRAADRSPALVEAGGQSAQAAQATIGALEQLVTTELRPALDQGRQAAQAGAGAAAQLDRLVSASQAPVARFAGDGLTEVRHLVAEARQLIEELHAIADRLRANPSRFLLGRDQGGFEPER
jgi:phospholipid/cholesterol/gamma-HCH transport system substrate-binding protein